VYETTLGLNARRADQTSGAGQRRATTIGFATSVWSITRLASFCGSFSGIVADPRYSADLRAHVDQPIPIPGRGWLNAVW